ncbi:MAG: DUF1292 domain-containing protein [Erysipelotrichales bacterium]|nr:DUF1292 domain-containing protein [Erysipelotrichales bacterium]
MSEKMENELTIIDEEGVEQKCRILFTHHSAEFNKDYLVYEIIEKDAITAAIFVQNDDETGQLFPIESEEEWQMLDDLMEQWEDEGEGSCGGCGGNCNCEGDCECENFSDCEERPE